jgi:ABC-2 type transport system ATP-binding protein
VNILEINGLSKSFGNKEVLSGLNMTVAQNSVFGFVGQNGAGKTTTMKIILGLLKADGGSITVCGEKVSYGDTKTNRHIGFLPDVPEFYGYMMPMEYLKLCGEITGLSKEQIHSKAKELLDLVGLGNENKKISSFSRGMKQRLGIAQALLNEPKLLICDEPTSALDPIGRRQILDILLAIKGKTTVVFSTHILSDVESICDYVAFLHDGKIALQGSLSEVRKKYRSRGYNIMFENEDQLNIFINTIELEDHDIDLVKNKNQVTVGFNDPKEDGSFLIDLLANKKIVPLRFEKIEPSLENLFREVVK